MTIQTIDKIVDELKEIPENKYTSIIDYLHFIKWEQDTTLTADEEKLIEEAEAEIKQGKGKNWRDIKRNV
jgi:hypothetical protein